MAEAMGSRKMRQHVHYKGWHMYCIDNLGVVDEKEVEEIIKKDIELE